MNIHSMRAAYQRILVQMASLASVESGHNQHYFDALEGMHKRLNALARAIKEVSVEEDTGSHPV